MSYRTVAVAKGGLIVAGILLLIETLLGCVYVLGIGFSTTHDVITDLCLTMAFPVFLISLRSIRGGAIGLWVFFALQWIDVCSNRTPPGFVNPLAWIHGDLLFAAAILVSVSALMLCRVQNGKRSSRLLDVFGAAGPPL